MHSNDEIMDVLDQLKKEKDLSISEIARRVGMAKSAVSRYFNRTREFPLNRAEDFARVFGISAEELLGLKINNAVSVLSTDKTTRIPVIGEIACGDPILADENITSYREELTDLLPNGKLFYLQTKGDSMTPTIPVGSYVLIREQSDVDNGDIAAVLVNGDTEATLKRIKRQGDIVMLMPDNPDYSPYIITKDNPARILGKAIKFSADL